MWVSRLSPQWRDLFFFRSGPSLTPFHPHGYARGSIFASGTDFNLSRLEAREDIDAALSQPMVGEHQICHGFDDGDSAWEYARVMSALCF